MSLASFSCKGGGGRKGGFRRRSVAGLSQVPDTRLGISYVAFASIYLYIPRTEFPACPSCPSKGMEELGLKAGSFWHPWEAGATAAASPVLLTVFEVQKGWCAHWQSRSSQVEVVSNADSVLPSSCSLCSIQCQPSTVPGPMLGTGPTLRTEPLLGPGPEDWTGAVDSVR